MEQLHVRIIIEILGRPANNVTEALTLLAGRLEKEKGITILEKHIHQPKAVADAKNLFTSFMECVLKIDTLDTFFVLLMNYMPSNVECISPEQIPLRNEELNLLANHLLRSLHNYDAVTKKMIADRDFLAAKLKEIAPHLFKQQPAPQQQAPQPAPSSSPKQKEKKNGKKKKKK